MQASRLKTAFLAALAILGAWVGFANPILHFPAAALLLPGCLALLGLSAASFKNALWRGFWVSTLAYTGIFYWIVVPVSHYGGLPLILALPCPVLIAMVMAAYLALYTGLLNLCAKKAPPLFAGLLAGALWGALELARTHLITGFPWAPLSSAFGPWPILLQSAYYIGGLGLGALLAACGVWLAAGKKPLAWTRFLALALLALLAFQGHGRMAAPVEMEGWASVGAVQGNIDQSLKWEKAYQEATTDKYIELSRRDVLAHEPVLLVWPETAMPFFLQDPSDLSFKVRGFAREAKVNILTGAPAYTFLPGSGSVRQFNRAYLITPGGALKSWYDKFHLVPFGEYVPLGEYLPVNRLVTAVGDFQVGHDPSPLVSGDLALGVLICYETIFPELAQERVEYGANLLVNISNDAWFGKTSAPLQHLYMAVLRAVEQERHLVRSTNTGISAFIDPHGVIHGATDLFVSQAVNRTVGLTMAKSPYHKFFNIVRYGLAGAAVILALLGLALYRVKRSQTDLSRN